MVGRELRPDGWIVQADVRIGDSMLLLGLGGDQFGRMPSMVYLYVPDCDAVDERALRANPM